MARPNVVCAGGVFACALTLAIVTGGCGSDGNKGGGGAPARITGTLVAATGGCAGVVSGVVVSDGGEQAFEVGGDCGFSAEVPAATYAYVRFLDGDGDLAAMLSWEDPTVVNDGSALVLTSWFRLPAGVTHDLDEVFLEDLEANIAAQAGVVPAFAGTGGVASALPFLPPIGHDADGNELPDDNELGYRTGADDDGDGVPEAPRAADCAPPGGPLHGRITVTLVRDDLSQEELDEAAAAEDSLPPGTFLTETGFERGPIPARGAWIVLGDRDDGGRMYMADADGVFTIDEVPEGVATAKVYKNPGDPIPFLNLPLCLLSDEASFVPEIDHRRLYPDPCHMDSRENPECRGEPTDGELEVPQTHVVCGGSNNLPCCLDYDGTAPTTGKPHGARAFVSYWGSTCERYVDANCCLNEGGTIVGRVSGAVGLKQLTNCWRNHDIRNCQNIALGDDGLVLSGSRATRDAHDPSTNPETLTVGCNETLTLYHYNNTCQNEDNIRLLGTDCGTLDPVGPRLRHQFNGRDNLEERELTYTAPDHPCVAGVVTCAWGMCRSVSIEVTCEGGQDVGACCFTEGSCEDEISSANCGAAGGVFSRNATCEDIGCGACCAEDGTCTDNAKPEQCEAPGRYVPGGQCSSLECADLVQAVVLDYALGGDMYAAGEVVALSRVSGGFISMGDAGCMAPHLHADDNTVGVFIDGSNGPFFDMFPGNCGFGKLIFVAAP